MCHALNQITLEMGKSSMQVYRPKQFKFSDTVSRHNYPRGNRKILTAMADKYNGRKLSEKQDDLKRISTPMVHSDCTCRSCRDTSGEGPKLEGIYAPHQFDLHCLGFLICPFQLPGRFDFKGEKLQVV